MNLELLEEIEELRSYKKSYTEIADITGLTKASIVLALRLKRIYEIFYYDKLSSLNSEIKLLTSFVDELKENLTDKETAIERLNSLIDPDYANNVIIPINQYKTLKKQLTKYEDEIFSLKRKLKNKENYFNNLTFVEKLHLLFS